METQIHVTVRIPEESIKKVWIRNGKNGLIVVSGTFQPEQHYSVNGLKALKIAIDKALGQID